MKDQPIPRDITNDAPTTGLIRGDAGTTSNRPTRRPAAARVALAMTSLAAAALHFAVMGEHFAEHLSFGVFFSVVAWFQALWAVGIAVSASRPLLVAGAVGNLAVALTWAVSRIGGLPVGPEAGIPEAAGYADALTTALELLIVAGCVLLLTRRPETSLTWRASQGALLALALVLIPLTTGAIATGAGGEHHADAHTVAVAPGQADPAQLQSIQAALAKYRDINVALAEGFEQEHEDWPALGAHFVAPEAYWVEPLPGDPLLDLTRPEFLMYSQRLTGRWELVAVAYVVDQAFSPETPTELTGAAYHEHRWNCIVDDEELEEEDFGVISREACGDMGGVWSPGAVWMTHVWFIPNPHGEFAEENPTLL